LQSCLCANGDPINDMVELGKIEGFFYYQIPKKNQLLLLLPNDKIFIVEEKPCAWKFMVQNQLYSFPLQLTTQLIVEWKHHHRATS